MRKKIHDGMPVYKTTLRIRDPVTQETIGKIYDASLGRSMNEVLVGLVEDGIRYREMSQGVEAVDIPSALDQIKSKVDEGNVSLLKDLSDVILMRLDEREKGTANQDRAFRLGCATFNLLSALMRGMTLTKSQVDSGELASVPRWLLKNDEKKE